ncbi:tubulin-tyrosine ligase [Coniophora puteana RWD-64-598 SS2]|uniref:Tubulin-tyrosine ligase n=1 Tax=Coniophora puteana (strain RWD-64-598) TaxID=741705 RepID=A0A5M3N672_CONPW|nr:tubulin-tyrosine ligase [Coniophora puteana RWD-64-598 SS2]EIW86574.1 tubulin-tyrosine ligase [Coniophora puteana RWD-64-598 SS2]
MPNINEQPKAYVSWPSAPLTDTLVKKSLHNLGLSEQVVDSIPSSYATLIQWSTYDSIEHSLVNDNAQAVLSSSYIIRKALIRKHFLSRCILNYLTKHPESLLKNGTLQTWDIELSFADELDEMWTDDLYDLGNQLEASPSHWWILKPGMADRGMGIRMFNSKLGLQDIFEEFEESADSDEEGDESTSVMVSQLRHFVIQKYLPTPLLMDPSQSLKAGSDALQGYKFHLRTYCIASGSLTVYMYTRVLALFSSVPYVSPSEQAHEDRLLPSDLAAHLTNTCLQMHRGEQGVRLFNDLIGCDVLSGLGDGKRRMLTQQDIELILQQMADVLSETFKAALEMPVHFQVLPNAFELYGVDFLVSHEPDCKESRFPFQVKLLEVNAEPAIEMTGPTLTWILEDMFNAIGQVCVEPFLRGTKISPDGDEWHVGEVHHNLHKCLEVQVRGLGA